MNQPQSNTPLPRSGHPSIRAILGGKKEAGNFLLSNNPKTSVPSWISGGGATTPAFSFSSLGTSLYTPSYGKLSWLHCTATKKGYFLDPAADFRSPISREGDSGLENEMSRSRNLPSLINSAPP